MYYKFLNVKIYFNYIYNLFIRYFLCFNKILMDYLYSIVRTHKTVEEDKIDPVLGLRWSIMWYRIGDPYTNVADAIIDNSSKCQSSLDQSIQTMDKLLDQIDTKSLSSAKEQLKDL